MPIRIHSANHRAIALLFSATVLSVACKQANQKEGSKANAVIEEEAWYSGSVTTTEAAPLATNKDELPTFLDVRGAGDTAVDVGPLASLPGYWKGDLAFVNWESVVSPSCSSQNPGVDFFFKSSSSEIKQAHEAGFNIFSNANNHSRDCFVPYGPKATATSMAALESELGILWHGVAPVEQNAVSANESEAAEPYTARTATFQIKGKSYKVAFAAISIQSWRMNGVAQIVTGEETPNKPLIKQLLQSLQKAQVDFRILSIHTQDGSGNNRYEDIAVQYLKKVAESFIHSYNGNIVFGHGPHTKAGVKVVQRNDGRKGVIFTSLGNFLHPGLAPHYDNYVGRAVFDFETRQLRFVQVYPLGNTGDSVEFMKTSEAKSPISNFTWKTGAQSYYASFE